jgi:hypothetical protein
VLAAQRGRARVPGVDRFGGADAGRRQQCGDRVADDDRSDGSAS